MVPMNNAELSEKRYVLPQQALNAVPITRTPWGGSRIAAVKARHLQGSSQNHDMRIGESWEISTGNAFPSRLRDSFSGFAPGATLQDVLARYPLLLGRKVTAAMGSHSPLLLKWLHASDVLSLQVHPAVGDPNLEAGQDGKPESWLVMDREPGGCLYLGFQDGYSRAEIIQAFESGRERDVLYRFEPEVGEYICVPPGCVHAIDAGVLLAEPQLVMPGKEGVTLRVSDWGRRYNEKGKRDAAGAPRQLHWTQSLRTIDWDLPRGHAIRAGLSSRLKHAAPFYPPAQTPFPAIMYTETGSFHYQDLVPDTYSVLTIWKGRCSGTTGGVPWELEAGESAFVSPHPEPLQFELAAARASSDIVAGVADAQVAAAFFSISL
jgi:mannose-6-phosphate isomerase class I